MRFSMRTLVASLTASALLAIPAAGLAAPRKQLRLPRDYSAWSRVAACESGGWRTLGYAYPDSLGINRTNWLASGGRPEPPGPVSRARQIAEIRVADRFIARYGVGIPDRYGCAAW